MIRNTLAVNSAVLSSARSAPPMLLLAFSPPDEKSHISPCSLWRFSTHRFFSHRYYSEFGVDLEQLDIFLSNSSCGIASEKRLSQSWQAGSATTGFFTFFSTFSGVRHAASVYVSSCFWIYDARDEGTATGSRVLWEEARRNGFVSVECAWFAVRAL